MPHPASSSPNRLIAEQSPYLLQHAHNPVDWFPWGPEAFDAARRDNKPIFLSVGYSTCHWCHVMEHESFENQEIADILNAHFISIKVDREERPDIDRIHMAFVQATTGHGGWPMSVWLTPDLKPFAGGTYFPPEDRYGRPGFRSVLQGIVKAWRDTPEAVTKHSARVWDALNDIAQPTTPGSEIRPEWAARARDSMAQSYDNNLGGFGRAPKFPRPCLPHFLMRHAARMNAEGNSERTGASAETTAMALHTLRAMAAGGMHDQLAGGFHRYSVDARWHVPHFEKMLYDQAQLLETYLDAYQITGDPAFADVARSTAAYVLRDLTAASGGFYSAEDADSLAHSTAAHKTEGAFYVWTAREMREVLSETEFTYAAMRWGVRDQGNVEPESDPHGEFSGQNVLIEAHSLSQTAKRLGLTESEALSLEQSTRTALLNRRNQRPRPHLDDKVITAWNGLMIAALARSSQVLAEPSHLTAAVRAAQFVMSHLRHPDTQRLHRSHRTERGAVEGFADDYAFFISGLLSLYEASGETSYLAAAWDLQQRQDSLFYDTVNGGYFNTSTDDASLLLRQKEDHDGAEPSANSVSVENLIRMGDLFKMPELRARAEQTILAFAGVLDGHPSALPRLVAAIEWLQSPPKQIILSGHSTSAESKSLRQVPFSVFAPDFVIGTAIDPDSTEFDAPHWNALKLPRSERPSAIVCKNFTCLPPTSDPEELRTILQ